MADTLVVNTYSPNGNKPYGQNFGTLLRTTFTVILLMFLAPSLEPSQCNIPIFVKNVVGTS